MTDEARVKAEEISVGDDVGDEDSGETMLDEGGVEEVVLDKNRDILVVWRMGAQRLMSIRW